MEEERGKGRERGRRGKEVEGEERGGGKEGGRRKRRRRRRVLKK